MDKTINLEVFRYLPEQSEQPRFQTYTVPYREDWVVLDALNYIKDNLDGTLTYRWSCRMGVCGSCGMLVNGRPVLTCNAFVRNYSGTIRVEPLANFPIVRDLIVELDGFVKKIQSVKPWIIRKIEKDLADGVNPRDVKRRLARELVTVYQGSEAARAAEAHFDRLFVEHELPDAIPEAIVTLRELDATLPWLLREAGLAASASEARRLVEQGAVSVDRQRVTDPDRRLAAGVTVLLQVGKRRFARVRLETRA